MILTRRSGAWFGIVAAGMACLGVGAGVSACSSSDSAGSSTPGPGDDGGVQDVTVWDTGGPCKKGQYECDGKVAKQCDGNGGYLTTIDCGASGHECVAPTGCITCSPGAGSCEGGKAKVCRADGSGFLEFECDETQGMTCEPDGCKGACSPAELIPSYYGCDYFPTVTLNPVWSGFPYAVAVANTSDQPCHVTVTRGSSTVATEIVPAHGVKTITLPWVTDLKGGDVNACQSPPDPGPTRIAKGGAYRLRTDVPVTVYQFSPLSYEIAPAPEECPVGKDCPGGNGDRCLSYSNDASLLMPVTVWTADYAVMAWPANGSRSGFAAVTASEDGTQVQVLGVGAFAEGAGIDSVGKGIVTLDAGDVLQLVSDHSGGSGTYGADISSTRIHASKPIQVIGGHSCANIPAPDTLACDHVEHAMFPIETLGSDYLVTFPAALASESPHVVRVYSVQDTTTVHFDPPSIHNDVELSPDDPPLELSGVSEDVRIWADKALLIAQYMQGQASVPSGAGDPSMALAIPTVQFRTNYVFVAPSTFDSNFVNVIAPAGATIKLDDVTVPLAEFEAIGGSGYGVARVLLDKTDTHTITGSAPFGILVYGYGEYTSFMYPGGLDLARVTPPPIY